MVSGQTRRERAPSLPGRRWPEVPDEGLARMPGSHRGGGRAAPATIARKPSSVGLRPTPSPRGRRGAPVEPPKSTVAMPLESHSSHDAARARGRLRGRLFRELEPRVALWGRRSRGSRRASPVIIGFNGEFLSRPERKAAERLSWYGALGRAAAIDASVPCGFIFNECAEDEWTRAAVTAGFNLVMPADPAASLRRLSRAGARPGRLCAPA